MCRGEQSGNFTTYFRKIHDEYDLPCCSTTRPLTFRKNAFPLSPWHAKQETGNKQATSKTIHLHSHPVRTSYSAQDGLVVVV
jgi:hypothetical protein